MMNGKQNVKRKNNMNKHRTFQQIPYAISVLQSCSQIELIIPFAKLKHSVNSVPIMQYTEFRTWLLSFWKGNSKNRIVKVFWIAFWQNLG